MKRSPLRRRTPLRYTYRPRPGLAQARQAVRARSGGWCETNTPGCPPGQHRGTEAHHVVLRSQGGADTPGNLLWTCYRGHVFAHTHPEQSYAAGWLRRRAA